MVISHAALARFLAKVDTSAGSEGCWRWRGVHNLAGGTKRGNWTGNTRRPRFRVTRRPGLQSHVYVTRVMLSIADGVALEERHGLFACHKMTCPHDWCINPTHLYWGTTDDNVNDRYPLRRSR